MKTVQVLDIFAQKVADICKVPLDAVIRLREMGILDSKAVRDALVFHDYWVLKKTDKLTDSQILEKLAAVYNMDKRTLQRVVQKKKKREFYCIVCGSPVSKRKFLQNSGLCDRCVASHS